MPRIIDIILSLLALLILLPLLLPIVVVLLLTGEHKVFYLQNRVGYKNQNFKIIKFATMLSNSANMGSGSLTLKNDPRVLPFGKFLRKTKINELPQLLNILFGDMSIIGPRPLTNETFSSYSFSMQEQINRVKPGLSGVGSIIFRNEEEIMNGASASIDFYKNVIAPYKGSLEVWFIANKGIYIYFIGIFITIWAVIFPKTKIAWKLFKSLPKPPENLKQYLNYP